MIEYTDAYLLVSRLNSPLVNCNTSGIDHKMIILDRGSYLEEKLYTLFRILKKTIIPFWSRSKKRSCIDILSKLKPDVVLFPFANNSINCYSICLQLKIPYVNYFLGADASKLLRDDYYRKKIVESVNHSILSFVLYQGMEQELVTYGCDLQKFDYLNLGVPLPKNQDLPEKFPIKTFLFAGRFVEKKAPLLLLKAFKGVKDSGIRANLIMVGDGNLFDKCQQFVEEQGLGDSVTFKGFINNSELIQLYLKSHVYVQHSVTAENGDKEGWPVSIAEAASYGLPIISTYHAGIPTQVIHNKTGFLTDENDLEALIFYMKKLITNESLMHSFGNAGKSHIEKYGNIQTQMKKFLLTIEESIFP